MGTRDYTHENALSKAREKRFQAKLKHDEAEILQKHLDEKGIKFTEWVRQNIERLK